MEFDRQRVCEICGRERRLNISHARYDACHCIASENMLARLKKEYAQQTTLEGRKTIGRRIGGAQSRLNKLRKNTTKNPTVSVIAPASNQTTVVNHGISCTWIEGLYNLSGYFARLLGERLQVFDCYYTLMRKTSREGITAKMVYMENDNLHRALQADKWVEHGSGIESNTTHLFVWALDKAALCEDKIVWRQYRWRVECDQTEIDRLRVSVKWDTDAVEKCLKEMKDAFRYPLYTNPNDQCWQRMVVTRDDRDTKVFNPMALVKIYERMTRPSS